jgi:hypothetical protein
MDTKKIAEAVLVGGVVAISLAQPVFAADNYALAASASGSTQAITSGDFAGYVQIPISVFTSSNVAASIVGDITGVGVNTASTKGMRTFGATTAGGAVVSCQTTSVSAPTPGTPTSSSGCPTS